MKCWWEETRKGIHPSDLTQTIYAARQGGGFYRADRGAVPTVSAADLTDLVLLMCELEDRCAAGRAKIATEYDAAKIRTMERYLALLSIDYDATLPALEAARDLYISAGGGNAWNRPSTPSASGSASSTTPPPT